MQRTHLANIIIALLLLLPDRLLAADRDERIASTAWIIEQARAWAEQACGGKWVISDLLAEDFQGTAPNGSRYQKPLGTPTFDANTVWSTDCSLDAAEVRYFGPDIAVVYGAESKTVPLANHQSERRCLVWTDTWLRRNGKWQIIAVQDSRVDCPVSEHRSKLAH